jgi:hypothetical protein
MATTCDKKMSTLDTFKLEDVYKDEEEVEIWDKEMDVEVAKGNALDVTPVVCQKEQSCERKSMSARNHSAMHFTKYI